MRTFLSLALFYMMLSMFFSCGVSPIDKKSKENLIHSLVQMNESLINETNEINMYKNSINTKLSFLKYDPATRKAVMEVEPYYALISHKVNIVDEKILTSMNFLIEKEKNTADFFQKERSTNNVTFSDISKIINLDSYVWVEHHYVNDFVKKNNYSISIKNEINKIRKEIILNVIENVKSHNGNDFEIHLESLDDYVSLKKELEKNRFVWKNEILEIQEKLYLNDIYISNNEAIKWNEYAFGNKNLAGALLYLNNLRRKLKEAEKIAYQVFENYVEKAFYNNHDN